MSELPENVPAKGAQFDRTRLANFAILAVFAIQLALVLPEHEPWTDEAQAWLLARDSSLWELLTVRLRYEGTPALWHLLLMGPAKLGFPYESMQLVGAVCATAGVAVLVFLSPFPIWLRALLPFSYFLGYQYAVVARNYCLLGLLFFSAAYFARRRRETYWPFALAVGLLAHVSLHATLFAGAIWLAEVTAALIRLRREGFAPVRPQFVALALLAANFLLLLWQVWPAPDILVRPPYSSEISFRILFWVTREAFVLHGLASFLVLACLLPFFWQRGVFLQFSLGMAFVYALVCLRYYSIWHTGVVFIFVLYTAWVALDAQLASAPTKTDGLAPWPGQLALGALTLVALAQIPGAFAVARNDMARPYSSSRVAAEYLRTRGIDRRVLHGHGYHAFSVQPYFDRNIFANFRRKRVGAYWVWNLEALQEVEQLAAVRGRPEFILLQDEPIGPSSKLLPSNGYILEAKFLGQILWRDGIAERDDLLLYRRGDLPESQLLVPAPSET